MENNEVNEINSNVAVTQKEENTPVVNNKKKLKKGPKIAIITVVLLVLLIGGGFVFLKNNYKAEHLLDYSVKELRSYVLNLQKSEILNYDLFEDDLVFDGNIELSSKTELLSFLNNLKVDMKYGVSLNNETINASGKITQDNASINGSVVLEKAMLYLDSKDIYNDALKGSIEENYFEKVKDALKDYKEYLNTKEIINIETLILNSMGYMAEALKSANISTKYNGLNVTYTYVINKDNTILIKNKFEELLKEDELYKRYSALLGSDMDSYFDPTPMTVVVKQNMLNKSIDSITITDDDETSSEKNVTTIVKNNNKYLVSSTDSDETAVVEIKNNLINVNVYDKDKKELGSVKITNSKKLTQLEVNIPEEKVNVLVSDEKRGNEEKITFNINSDEVKLDCLINTKYKNNSYNYNGTTNVQYKNDETTLDLAAKYDFNITAGKNIIPKSTISNAKDIESLGESDLSTIQSNLQNKITQFKLYEGLSSKQVSSNYYNDYEYSYNNVYDYDDYNY